MGGEGGWGKRGEVRRLVSSGSPLVSSGRARSGKHSSSPALASRCRPPTIPEKGGFRLGTDEGQPMTAAEGARLEVKREAKRSWRDRIRGEAWAAVSAVAVGVGAGSYCTVTARARALYMKADRRGKQGHRQAMYGREKSYSTCTGRKGMCVRSAPARGLNRYSTVPTSLAAENWMHHDHTIEATLAIVAVRGQETRWEQGPAPPLPSTDPAPDDIA